MLVQALVDYARTYLGQELANMAFETKPVPYLVEVFEDGDFAGVRERMREIPPKGKKGKPTRIPEKMLRPKSPVPRNSPSVSYPLLACDAVQYVLGSQPGAWTQPGKEKNHARRHAAFVAFLAKAAEATQDPALRACAAFYGGPDQVAEARRRLGELRPTDGAVVALAVVPRDPAAEDPGGPVHLRPAAVDYWRAHYDAKYSERIVKGRESMCLLHGGVGPVMATHDNAMGLGKKLGAQPSGVSLMSFDKAAFRSYGWQKNANSPVCPECAAAYVLALNDLLRTDAHRRGASADRRVRTRHDVGGAAFLYWTKVPSDDDPYALFESPQAETVAALLDAPWRKRPTLPDVDANDFYMAAVAGNGGRLLVRFWFQDLLTNVKENLRDWFRGLRIGDVFHGGRPADPPGLWRLHEVISTPAKKGPERAKTEARTPKRIVELVRRAFQGLPLSRCALSAALCRLRVAKGDDRLNPARIGLIRLSVNDIEDTEKRGAPKMEEKLQDGLDSPAYVCGRLLAVYDGLQHAAQGKVNVTVADRYFGMASTFPALAFYKLERLGRAHLKKLRRDNPGAAHRIRQEITHLVSHLRASSAFPGQLSLEDQGRFAIGFHHQKADEARRIAEAKARKEQKQANESAGDDAEAD